MEQGVSRGAKLYTPEFPSKTRNSTPRRNQPQHTGKPEAYRKPDWHFPVLGNPDSREIFAAQAPAV
jgi:hypothetical protein